MTREFILFSRLGKTDPAFRNLHDAGRLDIVHECIVASLFLSHGLRRNVVFNGILNGPPNPPLQIEIDGATLRDVRTDIHTWQSILKKVISSKQHPGINISKTRGVCSFLHSSGPQHERCLSPGGLVIYRRLSGGTR